MYFEEDWRMARILSTSEALLERTSMMGLGRWLVQDSTCPASVRVSVPFSALVIPAFVEMAGRQRWADSWKFAGCYLVHKAKFKDNERPRRQVPGA